MQPKLQNARLITRNQACDLTKGCAPELGIRIRKIRMVENVQSLYAKLRYNPLGNGEVLQERRVQADHPRTFTESAPGISENISRGRGEGADIEPLAYRRRGEIRIPDHVRAFGIRKGIRRV